MMRFSSALVSSVVDTRSAQRLNLPNVDQLSGFDLTSATLGANAVTLTFERGHNYRDVHMPVSSALVASLQAIGRDGRLEVGDDKRSRRLVVSQSGSAALAQVALDYNERVSAARAARAATAKPAGVRVWGATRARTPNSRVEVVVLSAGQVDVEPRYTPVVQIVKTVFDGERLALTVEIEGTSLLAVWESPDRAQLGMLVEGAGVGRLRWAGMFGEKMMTLPVTVSDLEEFHQVLKAARGDVPERRGMIAR